jgi:DNA-binding SARP family transcriptional activator
MGRTVELPDKERALLFAVAKSKAPINGDELADALWPESDGDAARNSLSVCLHRLRRHAGDARIIQHVGQGYVLHPGADVDLWRLEAALTAGQREEVAVLRQTLRDGATSRAVLGSWFAPFEIQLAQKLKELDRLSIRTESVEISQMKTPHRATRMH